jgi:putative phosphoribosyl transferase
MHALTRFRDRVDAGRQLAARLKGLAGQSDLMVLALPRGGVAVGFEVARALGAPLDVLVVRKLGVPGEEELAMGAIASGGVVVLNQEVIDELGVPQDLVDAVAQHEARELQRREAAYRDARPAPKLQGRTVLLVDDGIATGSTMRAAIEAVRAQAPARVIVAAPTMSERVRQELATVADEVATVVAADPFYAISMWYDAFPQLDDAEVRALLQRSATPPA